VNPLLDDSLSSFEKSVEVQREEELQIPPLRYPGFPVDLDGVGGPHAPFLKRKAHTWPCPALRGRKSGFASVPRHAGAGGMTKGRAVFQRGFAPGMCITSEEL
jgi:hypothetical protein